MYGKKYYNAITDAKEIVGNWWYDTNDTIDELMSSIDDSSIIKKAALLTVLTLGMSRDGQHYDFHMPSTIDSLYCFRFIKNRVSKRRKLYGDGICITKKGGHWMIVEGKAISPYPLFFFILYFDIRLIMLLINIYFV